MGFRSDGGTGQAIPDYPINNLFPTVDFGVDPLLFQTQQADPAGIPLDNAWLENFLAYDFVNDLPLAGIGSSGSGTAGGLGQMPIHQNGSSLSSGLHSTSPSGLGDGSQKGKNKAKFRVPYFRYVAILTLIA